MTRGGGEIEGGENEEPIRNAFANLSADIKFGGLVKSLEFQPSEESAAIYTAEIIPTSVGSYSLVFEGQVQVQNISTTVPIEDVEDTSRLEFPRSEGDGLTATNPSAATLQQPSSSSSPSSSSAIVDSNNIVNALSNQIGGLMSDMSNQLAEIKAEVNITRQSADEARESVEASESAVDRAYVVGMVGIGTGVAGIVLALFFSTKKDNYKIKNNN